MASSESSGGGSVQQFDGEDVTGGRLGPYVLDETLGTGTYGRVVLATNTSTGERVAIKIMRKDMGWDEEGNPSVSDNEDDPRRKRKDSWEDTDSLNENISKEISSLQQLSHPNVTALREVWSVGDRVFIVMELAQYGDLESYVDTHGRLSENTARKLFRQLVDAFIYCHKRGIFHMDLKPANVLVAKGGVVKLADFGVCLDGEENQEFWETCGTVGYAAPEVWSDEAGYYNVNKATTFSLGVVLYFLVVGNAPWIEDYYHDLESQVAACRVKYPSWLSRSVVRLLRRLICADPARRLSLKGIRKHPWVGASSEDVDNEESDAEWDNESSSESENPPVDKFVQDEESSSSEEREESESEWESGNEAESVSEAETDDLRPNEIARNVEDLGETQKDDENNVNDESETTYYEESEGVVDDEVQSRESEDTDTASAEYIVDQYFEYEYYED